jgi:hypothetical protein
MRLRHASFLTLAFLTLTLVALAACGISSANENSSPPTSAGWPLTLGTNHSQYAGSEAITVTVTNHTNAAVYALDTRASCSVLTLQVQVNGQWQDTSAAPCAMKRVAMPVKINAGATYTATIRAGFTDKSAATFPTGTYRFVLVYYATQDDRTGGTTIYSAALTVTSTSSGSSSAPSGTAPGGVTPGGHP